MRSLKLEQVAIIRFLTLEGSSDNEIYRRIKRVFGKFTLVKDKIFKLHYRFMKEGSLGIKIPPPDEEDNDPTSNSFAFNTDENRDTEENSDEIYSPKAKKKLKSQDYRNYQNVDNGTLSFMKKIEKSVPERAKRKASVKAKEVWRSALTVIKNEPESLNNSVSYDAILSNLASVTEVGQYEDLNGQNLCSDGDAYQPVSQALPHSSIFKSEIEAAQSISPKQLNCNICKDREFEMPFQLKRHFKSLHLSHKVKVGPFISLLCRCGCNDSSALRSHYHCPVCEYVTQKIRIVQHYKQHFVLNSNLEEFKLATNNIKTCICIDKREGLYLVPKTFNEPTHVIKGFDEDGIEISKCSESLCQDAMATAKKNGVLDLQCKHIQRASEVNVEYVDNLIIFKEIMSSNDLNICKEEKDLCFYLIERAMKKDVPPLVEWTPRDIQNVVFFSVFCDSSYGILGRVIVKYEADTDVYYCRCPFSKENFICPYERLCQLYQKFSSTLKQ